MIPPIGEKQYHPEYSIFLQIHILLTYCIEGCIFTIMPILAVEFNKGGLL